ncbi:type 1 glutamine amidotransferase domain-containing protein [Patulibacter sp. SYSU D01012]|uniref:type 1 glutamine amidotransferase domain-containing protein n=1 Tax=Patulibacter sp. SYSU D01012 TaxID=2817381 RepID=UPI001B313B5A|nr:type 1 glutamine amidotransferase domain-containing protein [Patulibacter sp. SYSU D01012]
MTHVLIVLTAADHLTLVDGTKHPTGFWAEELVAPYRAFHEAGYDITIATPGGAEPKVDEGSLAPEANDGDEEKVRELRDELNAIGLQLTAPAKLEGIDPHEFDVVFVPGGHGPMEDLAVDDTTGRILTTMLDDDAKIVASVCHGPAALLAARRGDGSWPFADRTLTAFTNEEEHQAGLGETVVWLLEDRLRDGGAKFEYGEPWAPFVIEDRNLITGQNPASSQPVADRIVALLEERRRAEEEAAEAADAEE